MVAECKTAAKQAALGADDKATDAAEAKQRTAQIRVETLSAALAETEQRVADLTREVLAAADKAQRAATVAEIEQLGQQFATGIARLITELKATSALSGLIAAFDPNFMGLNVFTGSAVSEIEANAEMLRISLKTYRAGILNGRNPATLPQPAPAPKALPPPVELKWAFSTKPISWTDASGAVHTEHAWWEVKLPPETFARAIRIGAVVTIDSPLARTKKGFGKTTTKPKPADCVSLDDPAMAAPDLRVVEPVRHTAFQPTPIDRGKGFTLKHSEPERIPATAARNLKDE